MSRKWHTVKDLSAFLRLRDRDQHLEMQVRKGERNEDEIINDRACNSERVCSSSGYSKEFHEEFREDFDNKQEASQQTRQETPAITLQIAEHSL